MTTITIHINDQEVSTMATKEDLKQAVEQLKTHIETETSQVQDALADLNAQLEGLKQGAGRDGEIVVTREELDELVQSVNEVAGKVDAIYDPEKASAVDSSVDEQPEVGEEPAEEQPVSAEEQQAADEAAQEEAVQAELPEMSDNTQAAVEQPAQEQPAEQPAEQPEGDGSVGTPSPSNGDELP